MLNLTNYREVNKHDWKAKVAFIKIIPRFVVIELSFWETDQL